MVSRKSVLDDGDFARLLAFRDGIRRFLHWSDDQARTVGLTGAQHQLLLVVRGHASVPSISEVAEHLLLRHHSVVGLVDRAEGAGLIERFDDSDDQRVVRLRLTAAGAEKIEALSAAHLEELSRLEAKSPELLRVLGESPGNDENS